ncbi:coproporphyrinogen III oxidase [Halalkalibacter urbisdiaboli]|uniref:coproporphyrinogen III oxidase n=1 Tax=Halalkalibacter urbisdiaboli TaxID=1960589 RepID=UPI000B44B82F|nr:coproporphyrinogen III oxidase [Halalkalibacter urbisdiaboli]
MNISVIQLDERHKINIEHISALFFEDPLIYWNEEQREADLTITINVNRTPSNQIFAQASLIDKKTNETNQVSYTYPNTSVFATEDVKKVEKRTVNHVYLLLLQSYTGVRQPWGILTGIRPTKLMHQMRRAGLKKEEIRRELKEVYLVTTEKINLLERIVTRQLAVLPDLDELDRAVSIYIGIPFCPTKCAYCTFPAYAINGQNGSVEAFLEGLHYEIEQTGKWLKENKIDVTTVYYGGGTPTSISAEQMNDLYSRMYESFPDITGVRELTVEAGRPDTITPEKIAVMKNWKVDRISINPQSFENETLQAIGRHHSVEETIEKYQLSRKLGLENINMDLIIGLPGEGLKEMEHTLKETGKLHPESLTVHTLSFKRASTMTKNKEKYKVASRAEISQMMELSSQWTAKQGYAPYYLYRQKNILGNLENVGYALPSKESLYNIIIMEECQTIIGLGCGAASKFVEPGTGKITRYANPKDPRSYNERFKEYTHEKLEKLSMLYETKVK